LRITAAVLVLFWIAAGSLAVPMARQHDFLNIYTGASLANEGRWGELHDVGVQLARERRLAPSTEVLVPFVRPHFYALFLSPLALFPFNTAFVAWIVLQSSLYLAFGFWAWRRFGEEGLVWWALFLPGAVGIAHGQDGAVMLLVLLGGFALAERDKPFEAGLVWSLALMKFHLCFGLLAALFVARRWRILTGFISGGSALASLSIALAGEPGVQAYIAMLTNKNLERLSPTPAKMTSIQGIMANFGTESAWFAAAMGIMAFSMLLSAAWKAPLWRVIGAGMAGGLFIVPHVYLYDLTALLLPLMIAVQPERPPALRLSAFALIAPIVPLLAMFDPPLCAAPAIALLVFLCSLALTRKEAVPAAQPVLT